MYKVRSLELRGAKVKCIDRKQWRDFVNGISGGMTVQGMTEHTFDTKSSCSRLQRRAWGVGGTEQMT